MENITDTFVDGLYDLMQSPLDSSTVEEAKKCLLDYLAVTFAGSQLAKDKSQQVLRLLNDSGSSKVIGLSQMTTITNAILVNGIHSHVIELDDGHRFGMMHPSGPIISALLPVAEHHQIKGGLMLKAIVTGYEAAIRIACAAQPSLKLKGYHGTGIAGSIGAAVALATIFEFSKSQLKNAISAAATSASGILKVIKNVSEMKPYNVGNAALNGYQAVILAKAGFQGPHDVLGGSLGFLSMFSDAPNLDFIHFTDNYQCAIHGVYRKPYAACRHCHAPIEASLLLKEKADFALDEVVEIKVHTYDLAVAGHEHTKIEGINSAKMSVPYSVAVALMTGKANLEEFSTVVIQDASILALTQKVETIADSKLSKLVPEKRAAIVEIRLKDGTQFQQRVDYPKGEPENPITRKELIEKFTSLTLFAQKSSEDIQEIIEIINSFEEDYTKLYQYL